MRLSQVFMPDLTEKKKNIMRAMRRVLLLKRDIEVVDQIGFMMDSIAVL